MATQTLSASALAALRRGDKLEAIKVVRAELGLGLKEARDAVNAHIRDDPDLAHALAAARSESNARALWWLAAVVAFFVLAYVVHAKVGVK
jgi:ribosomal protein L7/L12